METGNAVPDIEEGQESSQTEVSNMNEDQLLEVDVDTLLGNGDREKSSMQGEVSIGKMPWVFIGISVFRGIAF